MRVSKEFVRRLCHYFFLQRWLPFHLGIEISISIFNAVQRIKVKLGGKRICCMSIYIRECYEAKLNRTLVLIRFIFCLREPKGSVTDRLA